MAMTPVLVKDFQPCEALQPFVRKYSVYRFSFAKDVLPPVKFHAPRPEHSITFYPRDKQRSSQFLTENTIVYPSCVINGIYTKPIYRFGGNDFLAIKVVLQPTGLYQLKIIDVDQLTNQFVNAEDFLNKDVEQLCEHLSMLTDIRAMINGIERFLIYLFAKRGKSSEPFDKATVYILNEDEPSTVEELAYQSCLSERQFIRKFEEQVGVSPKMFQKIARFDRAFRLKNNNPDKDWLYIALASGYYDYQHMVKDFKEFTNLTPPSFFEVDKASPERTFGLHEG